MRALIAALAAGIFAIAVAHARPTVVEPPPVDTSFYSRALEGRLKVAVYLPVGYGQDGRAYPVVYFLHGLPASPTAYRGASFLASALRDRAILVAPQGDRDGDSDPEYLDWGPGRNWDTALGTELPAWVDAHFRTIPSRRGRAIIGLSAGGYGAFMIGLHHLDAFGAIESWSGYFHPTDPTGTQALNTGSSLLDERSSAHALLPSIRAALRVHPTFVGFYVGAADTLFVNENKQLHLELTEERIPHRFSIYAGGHEQTLWQAQAPTWLSLALGRLERARG